MRLDRLEAFIKFFETVPEEHFDLARWASEGFNGGEPACGSTACIGGWLAVSKEFQEAGGEPKPGDEYTSGGEPIFKGVSRDRAFAKYFEISEKLATDITTQSEFYGKVGLSQVSKQQALRALKSIPRLQVIYKTRAKLQQEMNNLVHEIGTAE